MTECPRAAVRAAAVVAPVVVAAVAGLARDVLANTSAALVLVLVVVVVGVAGDRIAGLLAAVAAAVSFDFFLTAPYLRLTILDREDVETAILLLVIGLAVTEAAQWGRRQQARAALRAGHLSGVARAAGLAAGGVSAREAGETIARMIGEVLDLDDCRFEEGAPAGVGDATGGPPPVLHGDGTVTADGRTIDVRREGLPVMDVVHLPAGRWGEVGRFVLTASSGVRRPDREQLLVAATLAGQVARPAYPHPAP